MTMGHNSAATIDHGAWAWEVARSEAHAYVKLIAHTLRVMLRKGQDVVSVSDERLAALTSLSVKTVRKYRKEASDNGWIQHRSGDGRGKVSEYRMAVPQQTLSELAELLDGVKGSIQKVPLTGGASKEKVGTPGLPSEERSPSQGGLLEPKGGNARATFGADLKEKIPHTPLKENNIYIIPSVDNNRARVEPDGVHVNGEAIHVQVKGKKFSFPYSEIDYWGAMATLKPERAREFVEAEVRGWVVDGFTPDRPSNWLQSQMRHRKTREVISDIRIETAKKQGVSRYGGQHNSQAKLPPIVLPKTKPQPRED